MAKQFQLYRAMLLTVLLMPLLATAQTGGTYNITQSVIAGGGGQTSTGGNFTIDGTIGQPLAGGLISTAPFNVFSGFWTPETFAPTLQFSAAVYGVNENGNTANITVNRTGDTTSAVAVNYAASNGTATGGAICGTAGVDYLTTTGILNFAVGITSQTFAVQICDDALVEGSETVNLALSMPVGATLGTPNTAILTITDNDIAPTPTPTPTQTPTPTPGGNVCTLSTTVTEGDLFPGGLASFGVTSGAGSVTVDHVNAGTGLQSLTVVNSSNVVINIPAFTPGTFNPTTATFSVINSNQPVDFTLRAASQFHAIFIRARCACTPTLIVMDDPSLFPGGLTTFIVTNGMNMVTVDSIDSGTGLRTFTVVNATNAVVMIPAFTPGTFAPVTATYTITNPALPVDITLRAAGNFHGVIIRLRCGQVP